MIVVFSDDKKKNKWLHAILTCTFSNNPVQNLSSNNGKN